MHLCLISDFFPPEIGGVQTHVYGLARTAARRGYRVTVVTTVGGRTRVEYMEGIKVIRIIYPKYSGFFDPWSLKKRLRRVLTRIRPDIVHAHHAFSPLGMTSASVAKELGIPAILTSHSIPIGYEAFRSLWNVASRIIMLYPVAANIKKYDAIIAVSRPAAEYISLFYPKKIHIVPPPIDDEFFEASASKEDIGFSEDDKIVLFVGRLDPKKGLEFALYAFRLVVMSEPRARLCIVGPGRAPYLWHLRKLVDAWGLEENVFFVGKIPRSLLVKYYAASDVFVFPSYGGESFGIVVLESMASGTPVVTTLGGALGSFISKYGLGLVTGFSTVRYARAILTLLRSKELRERMGRRARRFARLFSWDRLFRRIEGIYRAVYRDREG